MQEIRFDTSFECSGRWRIESIEGKGRFAYEPATGMTVDLTTLDSGLERLLSRGYGPFTITGRTSYGDDVAFFECYLEARADNGEEFTASFLVNRALFGPSSAHGLTSNIRSAVATMTA